jgi:GAF domain-containing protein
VREPSARELLDRRTAELALINSIQQGLAAKLGFQAIVDLVGDKLRKLFRTLDLGIAWYDDREGLLHYLYAYERGKRLTIPSVPPRPDGLFERMSRTQRPRVLGSVAAMRRGNVTLVEGTEQSKSMMAVPIVCADRVRGMISIENYEREDAYSESDVRVLSTIAASLGTALENARLFDETQRLFKAEQQRAAELAVINSIQQGMAAKLEFQAIVDLVGDKLRDVFQTGDMGIRWYDPINNLSHYLYQYEHGVRQKVAPTAPREGGPWSRMVRTRQPIVFGSRDDAAAQGIGVVPGTDTSKSAVFVPIIGSNRVLGSIVLENYERENAFGEGDVRLITTVAASMGVALENARLFDETQRLFKQSEQRAAELAIINSVQEGLAAQLEFQAIIDLVGDKIAEIFKTPSMSITLYDRQTNMQTVPYYLEHHERFPVDPMPSGAGFTSQVIRTRQPLLINQDMIKRGIELGSRMIGDASAGLPDGSYLGVPILKGEEAVGVVALYSDRQNAYGDSDVRLLTTLANAMSVALENAHLFDETQRLLKETEQRAAELAIINSVQQALAAELNMQGHLRCRRRQDPRDLPRGRRGHTHLRAANQRHPLPLRLRGRPADHDPFPATVEERVRAARPAHARDAGDQREHGGGLAALRQLHAARHEGGQVRRLRAPGGGRSGAGSHQPHGPRARARVQRLRRTTAADPGQRHERGAGERAPVRRDAAAYPRGRGAGGGGARRLIDARPRHGHGSHRGSCEEPAQRGQQRHFPARHRRRRLSGDRRGRRHRRRDPFHRDQGG